MKIKEQILAIFLIMIISCDKSADDQIQSSVISGDWFFHSLENNWSGKSLMFSFEDTICSYLYPYGEFTRYWIESDTLKIKEKGRRNSNYDNSDSNYIEGDEIFKFLIDKNNENTITLSPLNQTFKEFIKRYENVGLSEKLILSKTSIINDFKFERIGFYSSGCYGTCPVIYLEIDANGNLFFYGKRFTEKYGLFKGKLDRYEIDLINRKINAIELDSLKKSYSAKWTDDQTSGIKVKIGDNYFESSAYGRDKEPVELRFLLHKLMEIYKSVELENDSTVVNEFKFGEFVFKGSPPPPPPPPPGKNMKFKE